jgi:DNA-directed RNA polymerase sigma subunit (sigma70/sigma32)
VTEEELAAIELRADDGCEGHAWPGDEKLYCPCVEQTAVDVRVLVAEVRRLHQILGSPILSSRQRAVLTDLGRGETVTSISKAQGVSVERIRQIEFRARNRLRHARVIE